jgi:hypothetical protein
MNRLPSLEQVQEILSYDPESGEFRWKDAAGKRRAGKAAGCPTDRGYWRIRIAGRSFLAHRLAWLLVYGEWPSDEVDHINRQRSDNRLSNLRVVTRSLNRQNEDGPHKQNLLGVRGVKKVSWGDKYEARILIDGKYTHLGTFTSIGEAKEAYENARRKYHPGSPAAKSLGTATPLNLGATARAAPATT